MKCKYTIAWEGECNEKTENDTEFCTNHLNKKCIICKKQSIKNCDSTLGPVVCGAGLCENVECFITHTEKHHGHFSIYTKEGQSLYPKYANEWANEWEEKKKALRKRG
jgi:hypothetical protein